MVAAPLDGAGFRTRIAIARNVQAGNLSPKGRRVRSMSPNTQVALIALILFFVLASVSLTWPRLAGLERSRMRLASRGMADAIKAPERALTKVLAGYREPLPPQLQARALRLGAAALIIS